MIYSVGIDVGSKNGAIAIINERMEIEELTKVPYYTTDIKSRVLKKLILNNETGKYEKGYWKRSWVDETKLASIFIPYINNKKNLIIYTVERVSVRTGEGEASSFNFGTSQGIFWGLYAFLNPISYKSPLPQEWKKYMGVTADKDTSIQLAESIFNIKVKDYLKKGDKKNKQDDLAEALLIAAYGLLSYADK